MERKPGVYLCKGCGIAEAVDVAALEKIVTGEQKIATCRSHGAFCSEDGVASIRKDIESGAVNQAIVAACSPRVMTDRFQFNGGSQVIRANLREQVAWCQPPGEENTNMMAADYVRMAIAQSKKIQPPAPWTEGAFDRTILVVGGGVSGLSAAKEAAKAGYDVILIERSDRLGGWARQWSKRLPHLPPYRGPAANDIEKLVKEVEGSSRIKVMTNATVAKTEGMPGKFTVAVKHGGSETTLTAGAIVLATGWRPYDPTKLGHLGYGASPDVVTGVELEKMLAAGAVKRKSDGRAPKTVAFIQCAGSRDPNHLPYCSSVCCGVSIKQALQLVEADPETSAYIIFDELRTPGTAEEFYRQAQEAGVIFMKGKVKSVGADLTVVVDDALIGEEVPMQGLDLVVLATGMVPNSTDISGAPSEKGAELLKNDINPVAPITVAGYAAGAAPEPKWGPGPGLAQPGAPLLNLQYRQGPHLPMLADGFADSHFICFPYETRRTGIYTCGPLRRPMDMAESAEDAAGAVLKAIQAIHNASQGSSVHPRVGDLSFPKIGLDICTKCRRCTVECPFGAIDEDEQTFPRVNPTRCRRCGTCMGACPVRTISFDNYNIQMVSDMIGAAEIPDEFSEKPRILILACENDAYPALDMAGINRRQYSAFVRVIPVRCLGSVSLLWISTAIEKGYDGVMLMGCKSGDDYQCHFVKGSAMAKERLGKISETLKSMRLEQERVATVEVAIADSGRLPKVIDDYAAVIDKIGLSPLKGF